MNDIPQAPPLEEKPQAVPEAAKNLHYVDWEMLNPWHLDKFIHTFYTIYFELLDGTAQYTLFGIILHLLQKKSFRNGMQLYATVHTGLFLLNPGKSSFIWL